jgi:DNA-binding CsgD family transcriptional regulator
MIELHPTLRPQRLPAVPGWLPPARSTAGQRTAAPALGSVPVPGVATGAAPDAATAVASPVSFAGSEVARCMGQMLDEIDYGLLLVNAEGQIVYLNHMAARELDGDHPLQRLGHSLRAARPQDVGPLHEALDAAQRGLRRLVALGADSQRVGVSVVPLASGTAAAGGHVLLVLGKREVSGQLAVEAYSRSVGLTMAETRVLAQLCAGVQPQDIARRHEVKISTIRAQIGSIRVKTGASSIRELVRQVAVLPPLVGALRAAPRALEPALAIS